MTKLGKRIVNDNQLSLLDYLQQDREQRLQTAPGRMNVVGRLQAAIRQAAKSAPKSREQIADDMTELLGETVTVHQVNNWLAESHPHRIPAEYLPAYCEATGSIEPLRIMSEVAGVFTLPGPEALRAEIQRLREEEHKVGAERRKREMFLKEMER